MTDNKAPKYLKNHQLFTQADYDYLANKGYTNKEIEAFWNRDLANGLTEGLTHEFTPVQVVEIITEPNLDFLNN